MSLYHILFLDSNFNICTPEKLINSVVCNYVAYPIPRFKKTTVAPTKTARREHESLSPFIFFLFIYACIFSTLTFSLANPVNIFNWFPYDYGLEYVQLLLKHFLTRRTCI